MNQNPQEFQKFYANKTLAQWVKLCGINPTHPTTESGAVSVISKWPNNILHGELWNLTDYNVSSVSGSVIWLTPKTQE